MSTGRRYERFEPEGDGLISSEEALEGINRIRNSIVGAQNINWSEHIYPLVALLGRAGYEGLSYPEAKKNIGTMIERTEQAEAQRDQLKKAGDELARCCEQARRHVGLSVHVSKALAAYRAATEEENS